MAKIVEKLFKIASKNGAIEHYDHDFVEFGQDIIESEELTDNIYSTLLNLMVKEFRGQEGLTKKDFHVSDIGLIYTIGPYIPCTKRVSFTDQIDVKTDGFPAMRVCANLQPNDQAICSVRPVDRLPNDTQLVQPCKRKYKYTSLFKSDNNSDTLDGLTLYFGISETGKIISPYFKNAQRPAIYHAAARLYPGLTINSWADARYLWLVETEEDIGMRSPLKLRLGLNKEHIKSLFYARQLPVTETGRKRPILHFVRAHNRRLAEGIDIDVMAHLRGITEFEMDGLRLRITQPNKTEIMREPSSVKEAMRLYA